MNKCREDFQNKIRLGRNFEKQERSFWVGKEHETSRIEAGVCYKGRLGRVDLIEDISTSEILVVELKATDWDSMASNRIRANALRHARQVWRYINAYLDKSKLETARETVHPAIVYALTPKTTQRRDEVEAALNEQAIQVVWRDWEKSALLADC